MNNRYLNEATNIESRIAELQGRIERFTERGVRVSSISSIYDEIAKLQEQAKTLRATHKWCVELYGQFA